MKRGYKRLLIFETFVILILLMNSLSLNLLSRYKMLIFLVILLFIFFKRFGFEKDKHRYIKDILLEMSILLFSFFICYYLLGIIVGFSNANYYSVQGIINFIIPTILYIILRELLRYMVLCKSDGNRLVTVLTVIMFILLDITGTLYFLQITSAVKIFKFIALTLLPAISINIVLSYTTKKVGYKPVIYYALVTELYRFLLPIVPNPSEYIVSIVDFVLPCILGYRIYIFFKKDRDDDDLVREKNKNNLLSLGLVAAIVIVLVYFTSGYFHFHTVAIASSSMTPNIKKGDVVIIEKLDKKYSKLKVGQVIAFKKDHRIIVHRLIKIIKQHNTYYFYTKGDNNEDVDNFVVEEKMIIGNVNHKIPYIGWPTVWFNEL